LADEYISVNQQKYLFKTQTTDSRNRKLDIYPRGQYLHTTGFWVIGVNNKKSWDSRYFGPISREQILTKLKPLIVW
jgi:type IV secretory pathway protease TraF